MLLTMITVLALSLPVFTANYDVNSPTNKRAQDFADCPDNCRDEHCTPHVGCSICDNGFCLHMQQNGTDNIAVCSVSCPSRFYCRKFIFSVCKPCKDPHCAECDAMGLCTSCDPGYTLASQTCVQLGSTPSPSATKLDNLVG